MSATTGPTNVFETLVEALEDLHKASTTAYKTGRVAAEAFVRAGNALAEAKRWEAVDKIPRHPRYHGCPSITLIQKKAPHE